MPLLRLPPGSSWFAPGVAAAVLLASCANPPGDATVSRSPADVAPTTTTTTSPTITTGSGPTTGPMTGPMTGPTTSPTADPNESPAPPRRRLQTCPDVVFAPASEDLASRITVVGMTCDEAQTLVRAVRAEHNFVTGPRRFTSGDLACRISTTDDDVPVGHYTCTGSGGVIVTWVKT